MNLSQKSRQSGFTVIELVIVAVILALAGALIFVQINNLKIANQDDERKTAINAMYYALEEVYYKKNNSYPQSLSSEVLPSIDPNLFTDPDGFTLGQAAMSQDELQKIINGGNPTAAEQQTLAAISGGKSPNYHYNATNCDTNGSCKSYTLSADLVGESEYIKKNRPH